MATVADRTLWLPRTEAAYFREAHEALAAQDPQRFVRLAPGREFQLRLVRNNALLLLAHGLYEPALLAAYHADPINTALYSTAQLRALFQRADRQRLRDAGEPLPHPGSSLVFRGVAGAGSLRRVRGFSWTASYDTAVRYALRAGDGGLEDPAVFMTTVREEAILVYTNARGEQEYLVWLPEDARPHRLMRWEQIRT
jgi:hypothetical protein